MADMAYVWVYQQAVYFIQKNSLTAWYLPPDVTGGELAVYPLNGFLDKGGSLLWGQSWSLASSDRGGLSSQNVFTTTEGQSAVFRSLSRKMRVGPWSASIASENRLGSMASFERAAISLSQPTLAMWLYRRLFRLISLFSLQALSATTSKLHGMRQFQSAAANGIVKSGQKDRWPSLVPTASDEIDPVWFVSNAGTGAWAPFTNWYATCVLAWNGRLFFGSRDGIVFEAMVGGTDNGDPFTGIYVPLFSDVDKPTAQKTARMARIEAKSSAPFGEKVSCLFDFDTSIPSPPGSSPFR